jgi:ATP-dependent Lon protease
MLVPLLETRGHRLLLSRGIRGREAPIENKRNFLDVSADIMEHVDPIFYGDPKTAAMKVLGLT